VVARKERWRVWGRADVEEGTQSMAEAARQLDGDRGRAR
jgi:hypothetical protein